MQTVNMRLKRKIYKPYLFQASKEQKQKEAKAMLGSSKVRRFCK
jgi:hypothetical protein